MTVFPSKTAAASCSLSSLHSGTCIASEPCSFRLQHKDRFGNKGTEPGDVFEATLTSQDKHEDLLVVPGTVQYNLNNNYDVTYIPTRSGEYRTVVTRYKRHVSGSLSSLIVLPGHPVAASSSAEGFGLIGAVKAEQAFILIHLRDLSGNPIGTSSSTSYKQLLTVATVPSDVIVVEISEVTTAVLRLTWTSSVPGTFRMDIKLNNSHIARSPFAGITVAEAGSPTQADKRYTTAEGQAVEVGAVAGARTHFVVVPRSIGGRAVTDTSGRSNAKYVVRMGPSAAGVGGTSNDGYLTCPLAPACIEEADRLGNWCCVDHTNTQQTGQIEINFIYELAGKLSFSIYEEQYDNTIESHPIFNSPAVIQVAPATISAAGSSITRVGSGGGTCQFCALTAAIAGVILIYLKSIDLFKNASFLEYKYICIHMNVLFLIYYSELCEAICGCGMQMPHHLIYGMHMHLIYGMHVHLICRHAVATYAQLKYD